MSTLTRMIVVSAIASLILAGPIPAQNTPDENSREALAAQREAQIAQKEAAQKQLQAAQQQIEASRKQAEVERTHALVSALGVQPAKAPAAPAPPASPIPVRGPWSLRTSSAGAVLVIPSTEIKAEDVVAIAEDMNVMSRIFEKNLEQARIASPRGGFFALNRDPLVTLLGGGAIESMYLQGCGALFLMKVDFPLSPLPEVKEEKQAEKKQESDPVWEQARRDLYEPQEVARERQKEPEVKYDAEKVETLKATLINTLKHAANIRNLKSDESVILTVTGSGRSSGAYIGAVHRRSASLAPKQQGLATEKGSDGTAPTRVVAAPSSDQTTYFSPTALVIRAKKADIDESAKGTIDAEQFRQRVQVLACPYLSAEGGFVEALNPYYHLQQEIRY